MEFYLNMFFHVLILQNVGVAYTSIIVLFIVKYKILEKFYCMFQHLGWYLGGRKISLIPDDGYIASELIEFQILKVEK